MTKGMLLDQFAADSSALLRDTKERVERLEAKAVFWSRVSDPELSGDEIVDISRLALTFAASAAVAQNELIELRRLLA